MHKPKLFKVEGIAMCYARISKSRFETSNVYDILYRINCVYEHCKILDGLYI